MLKKIAVSTCIITGGMLAALPASAQLAGKNVIAIHGFQPGNLMAGAQTDQQVSQNGESYWSDFWLQHADARIDWDSNDRIEGKTEQRIYDKITELSRAGFCNDGCVIVTHSTGDLVARYMLENQAHWLEAQGLQPLNILAAVDFAGAGGGTELADTAIQAANNDAWYMWPLKQASEAFLGFELKPDNMGVLHNLQPGVARTMATSVSDVPRLRMVGAGTEYGGVTKSFIKGSDDSVVPLHSACGAADDGSYDSCLPNLAMNGKHESNPAPTSFFPNHYPLVMAEGAGHGATISNATGNEMTASTSNYSVSGLNVSLTLEQREQLAWWQLWGQGDKYTTIKNSKNQSMSALVFNSFSQ
jgi:hypothetical protein